MGISAIKLEGWDEFIKAVETLPDKMKKQNIAAMMKKNLQPVKETIKNMTPVRNEKSHQGKIVRYRKNGSISTESLPGNLKRSIGLRQFTKGEDVSVYAGIQKGRNDGWYGYFVERGTRTQKGQHFIEEAATLSMPTAADNLTTDIKDYIINNAKKLGLDAK